VREAAGLAIGEWFLCLLSLHKESNNQLNGKCGLKKISPDISRKPGDKGILSLLTIL